MDFIVLFVIGLWGLWAIRTVLKNKHTCGHSCASCTKKCQGTRCNERQG